MLDIYETSYGIIFFNKFYIFEFGMIYDYMFHFWLLDTMGWSHDGIGCLLLIL